MDRGTDSTSLKAGGRKDPKISASLKGKEKSSKIRAIKPGDQAKENLTKKHFEEHSFSTFSNLQSAGKATIS